MRTFIAMLLACLALPVSAEGAPKVAAVQSNALQSYDEVLTGFASEAPRLEIARFDLGGDAKKADAAMEKVLASKPSLILALGPLAANAAKRATSDVPIVFCMVPNHEKYGLEAANVTGIALTRPIEDQLAAIHALVPSAKSVGVLYTPAYSQDLVNSASSVAKKLGIKLVAEKLGPDREAAELAAPLAAKVDAIWLIADRGTATVSASKALIAAARKNQVPLFALTEGQVREGALVAFTASPISIGAQAGRLGGRIAIEHVDPGAIAVLPPSGQDLWVNLATAKALALDATFPARVLDYAGQQGLAVRAIP